MTFPATISVIGATETGDFDVIKKLEVPFPQLAPNQILVKVLIPCAYPYTATLTID